MKIVESIRVGLMVALIIAIFISVVMNDWSAATFFSIWFFGLKYT